MSRSYIGACRTSESKKKQKTETLYQTPYLCYHSNHTGASCLRLGNTTGNEDTGAGRLRPTDITGLASTKQASTKQAGTKQASTKQRHQEGYGEKQIQSV